MKTSAIVKAVLSIAAVLALVLCVPASHARSASKDSTKNATKVQKHAQKIQKQLAHYKQGTLLHLQFNDNTECIGSVNTLSDASFTFNNNESNEKETHNYSDVSLVEKGKLLIGKNSVTKKRVPFGR